MKSQRLNRISKTVLSGLVLIALLAFSSSSAFANSTAGSTIINVVRVDYTDSSGNNPFSASASSLVTVNLVSSALNESATPIGTDGSPGLICLPPDTYTSGTTISSLYAFTATANGNDTYSFSIADDSPSTTADVSDVTRSYSTLTYNGTVENTNPLTRDFGSAIPVGISGSDTLLFAGGALAGFSVNDIVLVDTAAGNRAYLVAAVAAGTAPVYSNVGNVDHSTTGSFTTAEVQGTLQLKAYDDQTIPLNGGNVTVGGGGAAPAFGVAATAPTLGVPVGEMVLVKIDITASASTAGTNGNVGYTLTTTDGTNPATITCTSGVFEAVELTIKKEVQNLSGGGWGASATGNPTDILEYRVTVTNNSGGATSVVVTDAVPAYTTLVVNGSNEFAVVNDGINLEVPITMTNADEEDDQVASGDAAGDAAGDAITFYLGTDNTNSAGGDVAAGATYIIEYAVTID